MQHRSLSTLGRILTIVCACTFLFTKQLSAQSTIGRQIVDQYPTTDWGSMTYGLTWLPTDYYNTSNKYPLIIFLHGSGEGGDGVSGLNMLITQGLPYQIARGMNPEAVNPVDGQNYKFIVVSPQAPSAARWSYSYTQLQYIIPYVMQKYRVDPSRVYVTGISAGGAGTMSCVTNGATFAQKIAAIVPVSCAGTNSQAEADQIPLVGGTYGVKAWSVCGANDSWYAWAQSATATMNNANPAPSVPALVTGIPNVSHEPNAWNPPYDVNWRSNSQNLNIFEWMLKYTRNGATTPSGSTPVPTNVLPTVSAGLSQTITLPLNSATLSGNASDVDGSISSYQWSEVYGPSNATILSVSSLATVVSGLVAGTYTFRLKVTDNAGGSSTSDVNVVVNPGTSSSTAPSTSTGTLRIEAENYTNMYGIQKENTSDAGGGQNVAWQDDNDWMDYSVNVATAGTYTVNFRVASMFTGAQFQLRNSAGSVLTTVTVPNTGAFQTWQTVSASVTLPAGSQTLRIYTSKAAGGWNINWWEIAGATTTTTPPPTSTPSTSTIHIEAENFSSQSGIQTENTSDAGGGKNVGWQDTNDWMDYSVNVSAAGTYTLAFRVASMFTGAQFQLRNSAGTVLTTVTVPNTGSFQTWQTVTATATLPAGQQTLRIYTNNANGGWNFNWWEVQGASSTTTTTPSSSSFRIEAENYSTMYGVQAETTSDAGGGQNIGWQDDNDWMDYSVNVTTAGTYTVNFRVASMFTGAQFQLRNSSGTVLTTVTVPNTGAFQTWQTVSASVTLPAGSQTLRIYTLKAAGGWNINWWEVMASGSAGVTTKATGEVSVLSDSASVASIFPNPVKDRFSLSLNNELTGKVNVSVVSTSGQVVKQFSITKASKGATQWYLTISTLPAGTYIVNITMQDFKQSVKIVKE